MLVRLATRPARTASGALTSTFTTSAMPWSTRNPPRPRITTLPRAAKAAMVSFIIWMVVALSSLNSSQILGLWS